MAQDSLSGYLGSRIRFIIGFTLLVTVATLVLSAIQPIKYRSRVRLLTVQQYGFGVDPYNIAKATEYFSDLLAEIASSKAFFDEVLKNERVDATFFSPRPQKREKQWKRMASARTIGDTGIIVITVYHPKRQQAEAVASAIADVFTTKGAIFHGAGERLSIRVIDEPLTSEKPVQPQILLQTAVGALIGFLLSLGIIFFLPFHGVRVAFRVREEEV